MATKDIVLGISKETDERLSIDCSKSRRVLICGKTGTGKSYTMGVLLEEAASLDDTIMLVVDPQGIFWTMSQPNDKQQDEVYDWGHIPKGMPVTILVPGDPVERYGGYEIIERMKDRGVKFESLRLNPSDLSEEMWLDLFDLNINELGGIVLSKAVRLSRKRLKKDFFIADIMEQVKNISALDVTKEATIRKLEMASDWGIFEDVAYRELSEVLSTSAVNILDLSTVDQTRYGLRNLIVAVLTRVLFKQRTVARRAEALGLGHSMPKVWLAIDEAHNFCPSGRSSLSKEILIRWAKEGRQPGLSLVVASQQPSAIDSEVLTQCDLHIIHKITAKDDVKAINALSEDYMDQDIKNYITRLKKVGEAVIIDDSKEKVGIGQIRPRLSDHGGDSG